MEVSLSCIQFPSQNLPPHHQPPRHLLGLTCLLSIMSSSRDDPRIVRISSESHETDESHGASSDEIVSSDLPSLSRFGHLVFDNDRSDPSSPELDLSTLNDILSMIPARNEEDSFDDDSISESELRELDEESGPPPSESPTSRQTLLPIGSGPLANDDGWPDAVMDVYDPAAGFVDQEVGEAEETETTYSDSSEPSSAKSSKDQASSDDQNTTESDEDDNTNMIISRPRITNYIGQMMFVSGETAEPSIETTTLIEEITRQQVIEIVSAPFHFIRVMS